MHHDCSNPYGSSLVPFFLAVLIFGGKGMPIGGTYYRGTMCHTTVWYSTRYLVQCLVGGLNSIDQSIDHSINWINWSIQSIEQLINQFNWLNYQSIYWINQLINQQSINQLINSIDQMINWLIDQIIWSINDQRIDHSIESIDRSIDQSTIIWLINQSMIDRLINSIDQMINWLIDWIDQSINDWSIDQFNWSIDQLRSIALCCWLLSSVVVPLLPLLLQKISKHIQDTLLIKQL